MALDPKFDTTNTEFVVIDPNDRRIVLVRARRVLAPEVEGETVWHLTPNAGGDAWERFHHGHHRNGERVVGEDKARDAANEIAQVVAQFNAQ